MASGYGPAGSFRVKGVTTRRFEWPQSDPLPLFRRFAATNRSETVEAAHLIADELETAKATEDREVAS